MRTFQKTEDQGDFVIAPEGTQAAVLTCLAFLGKHEATWQGETRTRELVGLSWELSEPAPDGRRLAVQEVLTASMHEKAKLYSRILALTGGREPPAGFELAGLLGMGAIVTTAHVNREGRTFCNVSAVGPMPRGMTAAAPSVAPVYFDLKEYDAAPSGGRPKRFQTRGEPAEPYNSQPPPRPTPPPPSPWTGQAALPAPGGHGYHPAPQAAPAGQWAGSHQAQAPAPGWAPPTPSLGRPQPAPPAGVPFDDDIPF